MCECKPLSLQVTLLSIHRGRGRRRRGRGTSPEVSEVEGGGGRGARGKESEVGGAPHTQHRKYMYRTSFILNKCGDKQKNNLLYKTTVYLRGKE